MGGSSAGGQHDRLRSPGRAPGNSRGRKPPGPGTPHKGAPKGRQKRLVFASLRPTSLALARPVRQTPRRCH
jgi:hypothetical protein